MSIAGRTLFRLNRWLECRKYQAILTNGVDVFRQKSIDDGGGRQSIIDGLSFRNGPDFKIRDGAGATYIFHEIFLDDQYPKALLTGANTIIDVGANIGLFSYYARLHAPKARLIAIEADPDTFAVLDHNLAGQNVERLHQAVASEVGAIDFYSSDVSGWSSRYPALGAANARKVSVKAEPLSTTLRTRGINQIDFLKIDVEGAEYDILLGDTPLWDNLKIGSMIVEVDRTPRDHRYSMNELTDFLRKKFRSVSVGPGDYPLVTCLA
jgi:FkbM family methyltransferase